MIEGRFRDGLPRTTLALPGREGPFDIEFVVDTGFDGGLSLPENLCKNLSPTPDNLPPHPSPGQSYLLGKGLVDAELPPFPAKNERPGEEGWGGEVG